MFPRYTSVGRTRLQLYGFVLLLNVAVIVLGAIVNSFQQFNFSQDIIPFVLAIVTVAFWIPWQIINFVYADILITRAPVELAFLWIFSIVWGVLDLFVTMNWKKLPPTCGLIRNPSDLSNIALWCRLLKAFKAFIWIAAGGVFLMAVYTTHYIIRQHLLGNVQVWTTPLSRFIPLPPYSGGAREPKWTSPSDAYWLNRSNSNLVKSNSGKRSNPSSSTPTTPFATTYAGGFTTTTTLNNNGGNTQISNPILISNTTAITASQPKGAQSNPAVFGTTRVSTAATVGSPINTVSQVQRSNSGRSGGLDQRTPSQRSQQGSTQRSQSQRSRSNSRGRGDRDRTYADQRGAVDRTKVGTSAGQARMI